MQNHLMEAVEQSSMKASVPKFEIGDTVDVHVRILEGEKERIQTFANPASLAMRQQKQARKRAPARAEDATAGLEESAEAPVADRGLIAGSCLPRLLHRAITLLR